MKGGARPGAGRKPGSRAQHTVKAEAFKAFLIAEVIKEKEPIVKALIDKAKAGDVPALKEVLERVLGKPIAVINDDGIPMLPVQLIVKQRDG